ncbi:PPP1R11/YPI1 family protein [Aspergillus lucknowensis]|uniref:Type 1 phosphatases regulator n=1 Tax=Aspergillus lucknowensis TaxID=176173 RepID=A0ABR4M6K2_9EURO
MSISRTSTFNPQVSFVSRVEEDASNSRVTGTLRLRAADAPSAGHEASQARHIRWSENVVDNEGMGKKSSKVCCIYQKARPVGESSSESESSESDSPDSDSDRETRNTIAKKKCQHPHNHRGDDAKDSPKRRRTGGHNHDRMKGVRRKPSPNAYEKIPKTTKG